MRRSNAFAVLTLLVLAVPSAAAETATVAAPDGVPIVYEVRGEAEAGEPALVFVHCWGCDRTYWREQLDVFAADYRVVAMDLAGHGESGVERETWSVPGLAGDVEAVVDALGLERMILIGHSMGGPVALEAARRMPGRVAGIVAVDTLHNADYEFPPEVVAQLVGAFEADFAGTVEGFIRGMYVEGADPAVVDWTVKKAQATNQEAAIALMRDFGSLDFPAAFAAAKVPIRAINAAPTGPMQPVTEVEINRKYADFDAVLIEGVGHFLQLERPAEFNDHLRAAVAGLAAPAARTPEPAPPSEPGR
ncbi:MAG TPA: alpha/beta hydrolase [Thermoanaerobaculia bacterium]|nr:alpha/beta hydrolase [Thermoanaerobaculia bacterium]